MAVQCTGHPRFRSVELIDELGNRRCYQTNTPQPPVRQVGLSTTLKSKSLLQLSQFNKAG